MKKKIEDARCARREAILNIAREVFSREGYAATSMSNIASRLGGSKGTLYNYFTNKEELFRAHIQERCLCQSQAVFASPLAGDDPEDVLAELAEKLLSFILTDESTAFHSLVMAEAQRNPEIGRAFYASGPENCINHVTEYLERARAEGKIEAEDCRRAASDFVGLLQSEMYLKRVLNMTPNPAGPEIRADARHTAATFMRAYRPARPK